MQVLCIFPPSFFDDQIVDKGATPEFCRELSPEGHGLFQNIATKTMKAHYEFMPDILFTTPNSLAKMVAMSTSSSPLTLLLAGILGWSFATAGFSLEMEPRQWTHLPMNTNFGGAAYAYIDADIAFDPVLELENAKMESHIWAAKYIRTYELFSKSARVDFTQGYQEARWQGLQQGAPAATSREGLSDSFVRVAVNLYGAPALGGKDFVEFQTSNDTNTVVGVGLVVRLPTGHYEENKLLNISENRYALRPQFGISHQHGRWSGEATAEVPF